MGYYCMSRPNILYVYFYKRWERVHYNDRFKVGTFPSRPVKLTRKPEDRGRTVADCLSWVSEIEKFTARASIMFGRFLYCFQVLRESSFQEHNTIIQNSYLKFEKRVNLTRREALLWQKKRPTTVINLVDQRWLPKWILLHHSDCQVFPLLHDLRVAYPPRSIHPTQRIVFHWQSNSAANVVLFYFLVIGRKKREPSRIRGFVSEEKESVSLMVATYGIVFSLCFSILLSLLGWFSEALSPFSTSSLVAV